MLSWHLSARPSLINILFITVKLPASLCELRRTSLPEIWMLVVCAETEKVKRLKFKLIRKINLKSAEFSPSAERYSSV